jgi:hypothetical protein
MRDLSNNENRTAIAFQTAELSYLSLNTIFSSFSLPAPQLELEMEMKPVEFFFRFGVPDYWMDGAYYAPNPKKLCSKLWP